MNPQIKTIYADQHYHASVIVRDKSLVVSRNRKQGGRRVLQPDAQEWIEAIEQAIDRDEARALCRGVLEA